MHARWLVPQLGYVLMPLPGREASGCRTNPLDGVLDIQVPEPDRAVIATCGQRVPIVTERHRIDGDGADSQELAERAGVGGISDIPQQGGATVVAAAGQGVPVGTERHRTGVDGAGPGKRPAK